jgi:predicted nucleic acid-binding protein
VSIYVETSALAKRYVLESGSEAFEAFVQQPGGPLVITPLVATELHSVLARRLRMREIDETYHERACAFFTEDLQHAVWRTHPFPTPAFGIARRLIQDRGNTLATLDALHLASALELACQGFVTADKQLARAAAAAGLAVHTFS